jgi:hypothetical protein
MASPNQESRPDPLDSFEFSLCRGGPVYRLSQALGFGPDPIGLVRFGLAVGLFTWVPLAALTTVEGALHPGGMISFWQSIGTHVRMLVSIPLFFLAEALVDFRAGDVLRRILQMGVVLPRDHPSLSRAVRRATRQRDSWIVEALLLFSVVLLIGAGMRADLPPDVSTWRTNDDGGTSLPGWWYSVVSLPVFQYLFWRWCWRLIIWSQLLWRLARMDLQLVATHPDGAGGLAVLGVVHVDLGPLAFGANAVLASSYAEQILFAGVAPAALAVSIVATVVGATLVLIGPLAFFAPKLISTRQRGLLEYGTLADTYTRAFAAKWLPAGPPPDEPLLGTADIQSLADLGNSFGLIRNMSVLPMARFQILLLVGAAALPYVPLVALAYPLDELIVNGLKAVLNL